MGKPIMMMLMYYVEGGPAGGVNIIISCSSMPKTFGGKFHIKQNAVCSAMGPDQISTY